MGMAGAAVQPEADPGSIMKGGLLGAALTPPMVGAGRSLGLAMNRTPNEMPEAFEELQSLANKHKVSLPAGFIDKGLGKTQDALTHVPFSGMGEAMANTQAEAEAAARRLVAQLRARVDGSGTASEIAQKSGVANRMANRDIGHQIYDAVSRLAGDKQAPSFNTIKTLEEELAANSRLNKPDTSLATEIEGRILRLKKPWRLGSIWRSSNGPDLYRSFRSSV